MKTAVLITSVCILSFCLAPQMWALTYSYSNIQVPGSSITAAEGINNKGEVVGYYETSGKVYGFLLSNGSYTTISCPNATTGTYALRHQRQWHYRRQLQQAI